jgi:hypothetical protein
MLGEVLFVRSVPRCNKDVNTEVEAAALEAVTSLQPVKIQQTEKT